MNANELAKQKLLGTGLGTFFGSARELFQIIHAALRTPEKLGFLANDQLATRLVCELCAPNKTFVDVGSHIGSVIDGVLRHDSSISVIAVEAVPDKAASLARKFPRVIVHSCAAGEREETARFQIDTKRSGYSSLSSENSRPSEHTQYLEVRIHTLDSLVANDDVDVIKIDVEGAELGVINGAKRLLSKCRPIIMFESAPAETLGYTKAALWSSLADQEYAVVVPNRVAHIDPGLSAEGFVESHLYPRRSTNYFAIPRERRDEVRLHARRIQAFPAHPGPGRPT